MIQSIKDFFSRVWAKIRRLGGDGAGPVGVQTMRLKP